MLRQKLVGQEKELMNQRLRFSKRRKKQGKLKTRDWQTESMKRLVRRWWWLSETVRMILQVPMMGTIWKMRKKKRQSRASLARMTNPAGWCAQSPKCYSSTWRGFGRSRWNLTNWHNLDLRAQPTLSANEITSTAHPIWGYLQLLNPKQMMMQPHLHQRHLESIWTVLTLSPEYHKYRKGLLDQEVVIFRYILGSRYWIYVFPDSRPLQIPIYQSFRMRMQLNLEAFSPAYRLLS